MRRNNKRRANIIIGCIISIVVFIILAAIVIGIVSWCIMSLWNGFIVNYFGLTAIGFFDAMAIFETILVIGYGVKILLTSFYTFHIGTKKLYDKIGEEKNKSEDDD